MSMNWGLTIAYHPATIDQGVNRPSLIRRLLSDARLWAKRIAEHPTPGILQVFTALAKVIAVQTLLHVLFRERDRFAR